MRLDLREQWRLELTTWWMQLGCWHTVGDLGIWRYQENRITGQRRAQRLATFARPSAQRLAARRRMGAAAPGTASASAKHRA